MMLLKHFAPTRAVRDLRLFLSQRKRHEVVLLFLAFMATTLVIVAFVKDSHFEKPYERKIVYVQNWRADRSDAVIHAQQQLDWYKKSTTDAQMEIRAREKRESFKRLDDKLESWGF